MIGEDGETSVAQEELPPGTEDLTDPAKVIIQLPILQRDTFTKELLAGVTRSLPILHDEMERKLCLGLKRCLYVSSQANECQGGFKLASSQGLALKLKGSTVAHWPRHLHPEADMQGAYIPPPSTVFLSLASSWWCKSLAAGLAVFTTSGECDMLTLTQDCWSCAFFVCLYVESDRDREYAPQGDRGSTGSVQPQRTWSQQALDLWGRGRCLVFSTTMRII